MQTVWYFERPTVMWCCVHETTVFHFTPGQGVRCSLTAQTDRPCHSAHWVEFACDLEELERGCASDDETDGLEVAP
jgi:hypothetical protein